ncbi:MAG: hypothetical protein LBG22_08295, partial [Treponema sp.]|nr:hypothetical protein [Treponema sp.]
GSFRALKKGIKPRIQIPYENNIPRPFRARLLISDSPVVIPENKRAIITVLDENIQKPDRKRIWDEFREAIERSGEELPDFIPLGRPALVFTGTLHFKH